jgi:hypothetical protein
MIFEDVKRVGHERGPLRGSREYLHERARTCYWRGRGVGTRLGWAKCWVWRLRWDAGACHRPEGRQGRGQPVLFRLDWFLKLDNGLRSFSPGTPRCTTSLFHALIKGSPHSARPSPATTV